MISVSDPNFGDPRLKKLVGFQPELLFLEDGLSTLGPLDDGLAEAAELGLCNASVVDVVTGNAWYMPDVDAADNDGAF